MEQQGGDSRRITIYRPEDFEGMRRAGRLAAETLDMLVPHMVPGVTTAEAEELRVLKRRNRLLEQENEILRRASIFFAGELDPRDR